MTEAKCEAALEVLPVYMKAEAKAELNKKAHSAVILCLGNNVLREVTGETIAAGVWTKLETLYMTKSLANKLYMKKKLYTFYTRAGRKIFEHIDEFNKIVLDLANIEEALNLKDMIDILNSKEIKKRSKAKGDNGEGLYVRGRTDRSDSHQSMGNVLLGDNRECKIRGISKVAVQLKDGSSFVLHNVRYIHELKRSLISLGTLQRGIYRKIVAGKSQVVGELYASVEEKYSLAQVWHKRLGHICEVRLQVLEKQELYGKKSLGKLDFCENCVLGKSHRVSFGVGRHATQGVIDYVHSDLRGLSQVESLGGKRVVSNPNSGVPSNCVSNDATMGVVNEGTDHVRHDSENPNLVRDPNVTGNKPNKYGSGLTAGGSFPNVEKNTSTAYLNTFTVGSTHRTEVTGTFSSLGSMPNVEKSNPTTYGSYTPTVEGTFRTKPTHVETTNSLQEQITNSDLVSIKTPKDIDDFTNGIEAGIYMLWFELDSDKRTVVMDAICDLWNTYGAENPRVKNAKTGGESFVVKDTVTPPNTFLGVNNTSGSTSFHHVDKPSEPSHDSPIVHAVDINTNPTSYARVAGASGKDQPKVNSIFCPLAADPVFDGVNIFIPYKVVEKEQLDTSFLKEELTLILIWVKLHDVPLQVFEVDGISLIATFIGIPVMLYSYTSSMCNDSWGRSNFARCLVEVNSEADLVNVVTISIPSLTGDGFTNETIRVEYEWRPSRCDTCKIFGHTIDGCPKKVMVNPRVNLTNDRVQHAGKNVSVPPTIVTPIVVTPNSEKTNDGVQTVGKKKKKGKSKSTNGGQFCVHLVKQSVRYEPKATISIPNKGVSNSQPPKVIVPSSKEDNITMSNSYATLDEESDEDVQNVYDESANLLHHTQTSGSSSTFTVAAG
ncbi:retrovirus-related pol polyprotein from transposon TNT 1-94 [Tanacetum coccineum]